MKRILALVALAFLAISFCAPAHAARWVTESINFRKYLSTNAAPDSAWVYSKAGQGSDTTQAIAFSSLPIPYAVGPAAASDSASWFAVYAGQKSNTAPAIDTLYIGAQVSMDGANWTGLATYTRIFVAASTIPPVASLLCLEMNSTNTVGHMFENTTTDGDLANLLHAATAPTDKTLFGFNFIRFIVTWGTEAAQPVGLWIGHWSE